MVQHCFRLVIVVGLVLSGFSHAFCDCGCATAAQQESAPACPHCDGGPTNRVPEDGPGPCECRNCDQIQAVSPGSTAPMISPGPNPAVDLAPIAARVQFVPPCPSEEGTGSGPAGVSLGLPSDLPILLCHLLL